jgi:hypothetical protein
MMANQAKKPNQEQSGLSEQEVNQQQATALPDRDAMSLLDVNADLDLSLNLAAPVDAAIAANANVAAPIDAAVSANIVGINSTSLASADQDSIIMQDLDGTATATAIQDANIDQSDAPE